MKLPKPNFRLYKDRHKWSRSFFGFCLVYLRHYFSIPFGTFHKSLFALFQSTESLLEIIGFRGSAKSTIGTLAYPLYCALEGKHKFIILIADTGQQMLLNMANLRRELEQNELILRDYGNVIDGENCSKSSMVLKNGVRILGRSRGQKIRGMRHLQYRPDLIVVDDPEDLKWVKTKENRDESERWFNSEVVPAMQESAARLIVIGNFLNHDALMARIKKKGVFKVIEFPLVDEQGRCTWKAKYPTQADVDALRKRVGEVSYLREYQLKVVAEQGQPVNEDDIHYYPNELLTKHDVEGNIPIKILRAASAVDLAISERTKADCTAAVGGLEVKWHDGKVRILIKPNPVNKRVGFNDAIMDLTAFFDTLPPGSKMYVEDIGYQRAALETLRKKCRVSAFPVRPINDKRARLEAIAIWIKDGTVLFPETGCEELIQQLIGFGLEAHDDLVDALVYLILGLLGQKRGSSPVAKFDLIR